MLGFINPTTPRQKKNGFSFPAIARDFSAPSYVIASPVRASSQSLLANTGMDAATNGVALTVRMTNANWGYGANEMIFAIGDANNYIYFQKRKTGYKFRWGLVSNGNIQLIDEFSIDYLYDGNLTIGASIGSDEILFCINGLTISRQTTGITLPDITTADTVEIGQFFGANQPANPTISFDEIKIWNTALSKIEIENATFEGAPLDGIVFDNNLWTLVKAGQSNSKANVDCVAPGSYTPSNPSRMKMIAKDLTVRLYVDPYSTLTHGNVLTAFDDVGGFSAAGVTIDNLASQYGGKDFAAMPINRGGAGLIHDNGAGQWSDFIGGAVITTGDTTRISAYALAGYLSMLIARQYGHVLALEWYQGETDSVDGSTVTAAQYNAALSDLFDQWRLVLPPIRIVVGLSDTPSSGFSNWDEIQDAHAAFSYADTYHVSAEGLEFQVSEEYHLTGQGQYDLGGLVADKIIAINQ